MIRLLLVLAFFGLIAPAGHAQEITQTVTGMVTDSETGEPIAFANIVIPGSEPLIGTITDESGYFSLGSVAVGRLEITCSSVGYAASRINEILVTTGKAVRLEIRLDPAYSNLDEVVVKPEVRKQQPLNRAAHVSARMLSVEEARRFAGGFDDPARLAASFAGVASSSGGSNAIAVRGNNPRYMQWKLEGIEIPNPNHFANLGVFGGGGLTALSSNLLDNSDFMTAAFPAEYQNALSGIFDMRMRTGNNADHEYSLEAGLIGIDLASEGPLGRPGGASYLVNYRYSTLALLASLLPDDADGTRYQDLSFKLRFPAGGRDVFSIWGIGLIDRSGAVPEAVPEERIYYQDIENQDVKQYMGSGGFEHQHFAGNGLTLNSSVAFSASGLDLNTGRLDPADTLVPEKGVASSEYNLVVKGTLNQRFSPSWSNRTGITYRLTGYDLDIRQAGQPGDLVQIALGQGTASLVSAGTRFSYSARGLSLDLGLAAQWFALNDAFSLEPRFGASYRTGASTSLSIGYGLHSRMEPLRIYLANTPDAPEAQANKSLGFTRAHHVAFGFDWDLADNIHLKAEPYFQALVGVPITATGTESLINLKDDWFVDDAYSNSGQGRNYGLDLSVEHYMDRGFYYLVSGSVFQSHYRTGTSDWFNSRYNKKYLLNVLAGKEFRLGDQGKNALGINLRFSLQGGERYSEVDQAATELAGDVVYDESRPFIRQAAMVPLLHATVSYQWNRPQATHSLSLRLLNATNTSEFMGHRFNLQTSRADLYEEALMIPNLSYRISF